MNSGVNVKVVEDKSVERALSQFAGKLSKKYNKNRKINERFLKQKPLYLRIISKILNVLSVLVFSFCLLFCFSAVYNKMQNMPPSVGGYFCMRVSSGSMVNSGFKIGDNVIVRSVDTKTLKEGDIIAFYRDNEYLAGDANNGFKIIPSETITKTKYTLSFKGFFGVQSKNIKLAASKNRVLVFHHIKDVYTDSLGNRYYKTYGSSNLKDSKLPIEDENILYDSFLVQEKYVVGIYSDSILARFISSSLNLVSSPMGIFIILLIPVIIIVLSLLKNSFKNIQLAFLENDVVEEKRKLTDEICVKYGIGYRMSKASKYKVLAQAPEDKKLEYINLLWKTDNRPQNIRKYYLRKGLILRPMQKLRDLNRECEQMFKDGVKPTEIAKHYKQEKAKIQAQEKRYKKLLKTISENKKPEEDKKSVSF